MLNNKELATQRIPLSLSGSVAPFMVTFWPLIARKEIKFKNLKKLLATICDCANIAQ